MSVQIYPIFIPTSRPIANDFSHYVFPVLIKIEDRVPDMSDSNRFFKIAQICPIMHSH